MVKLCIRMECLGNQYLQVKWRVCGGGERLGRWKQVRQGREKVETEASK